MDLDKLIKTILIPLCIIVIFKSFVFHESDTPLHKGEGYKITRPFNWVKQKGYVDPGIFVDRTDIDKVSFYDPRQVPRPGLPPDTISVFSTRMDQAVWVDMVFPEIKQAIKFNSSRIIDSGKFNYDLREEGAWIIYEDSQLPMWNLEFYFSDQRNGFYKIRCKCDKYHFTEFRKTCEDVRHTFEFEYSLF